MIEHWPFCDDGDACAFCACASCEVSMEREWLQTHCDDLEELGNERGREGGREGRKEGRVREGGSEGMGVKGITCTCMCCCHMTTCACVRERKRFNSAFSMSCLLQ